MIPAPVLGKLLAPIPIKEQADIYNKIVAVARIYPFDVIAANIYGEMIYKYYNASDQEDLKAWVKTGNVPRQKVKIDYMIAAIAKANNVDYLYTDDAGLRKFASPYLNVADIPMRQFVDTKAPVAQIGLFEAMGYEPIAGTPTKS